MHYDKMSWNYLRHTYSKVYQLCDKYIFKYKKLHHCHLMVMTLSSYGDDIVILSSYGDDIMSSYDGDIFICSI